MTKVAISKCKLLAIALASGFAALWTPTVAQATKVKTVKATADKCAIPPSHIRRQCAMDLGGMCDPTIGTVTLDGPSGGSILGVQRFEDCVARKRDKPAAEHHASAMAPHKERPPHQGAEASRVAEELPLDTR